MDRTQAIRRFGVYYEATNDGVREMLGSRPDHDRAFDTVEAAVESKRAGEIETRTKERDRLRALLSQRFTLWRIKHGLYIGGRPSIEINAEIETARKRLSVLEADLASGIEVTAQALLEEIKLPVILEVGTPYWSVTSGWLNEGIKFAEHQIRSVELHPWAAFPYDHAVTYRGGPDDPCFSYPHDALDSPNITSGYGSIFGQKLFLNEQAAREHANKIAADAASKLRPFLSSAAG